MSSPHLGRRWIRRAAIGAGVALILGAGGAVVAQSATRTASTYVPTTPCRLLDTREGAAVGERRTPITAREVVVVATHGAHGDCVLPDDAVAIAANVTTLDGTATSFLTVWPADEVRPNASTNNWVAGQPPTPNKVDTKLSADGRLAVYNDAGTVDLIVDVMGYYLPFAAPAPAVAVAAEVGLGPGGNGGPDYFQRAIDIGFGSTQTLASVDVMVPSPGYIVASAHASLVAGNLLDQPQLLCDVTAGSAVTSTARPVLVAEHGLTPSDVVIDRRIPVTRGPVTVGLICTGPFYGPVPLVVMFPEIMAVYTADGLSGP